jgi:hypothetical protein
MSGTSQHFAGNGVKGIAEEAVVVKAHDRSTTTGQHLQKSTRGAGIVSGSLAVLVIAAGALSVPAITLAREESPPQSKPPPQSSSPAGSAASSTGRSGYAEGPPPLEEGDSVVQDLYQDDLHVDSILKVPGLDGVLDPWWDFKKKLREKYGLKLQIDYQSLRQWVDDSPGEDRAYAGRVDLKGEWTALGRNTRNTSVITFRMEYRDTLGTEIPPQDLGFEFGSGALTGTAFSDFQFQFQELAWRQTLFDSKWQFIFGKISASAWYAGHALSSPKRGFQNSAMYTSVAKPTPGRGLGFVSAVRLGKQWGLVMGIHDANARSENNVFDTIGEGEFYYSAEFRWAMTTQERRRHDQFRFQVWHQDERTERGIPSSQGITFTFSRLLKDRFMPFVVGGLSNGEATQNNADLTVGLGIGFDTKHRAARDVLGIGFSWDRPSNPSFRDQYTAELFYRFQLLQNIAFTPSLQYIKDPSFAPTTGRTPCHSCARGGCGTSGG